MFTLRMQQDWANQISSIRNEVTEDTNLIRFDNSFYRICRNNPDSFFVTVYPSNGRFDKGIKLTIRFKDIYVTQVGTRIFERYASTIGSFTPKVFTMDQVIHDLPSSQGTLLFEQQSLLVFCITESLRNDYIATKVEQMISASLMNLKGVPANLAMGELLQQAHAWGQTSDAIFSSLSEQAKSIVLKTRNSLSIQERQYSERINLSKIDPSFERYARNIKVLKSPG